MRYPLPHLPATIEYTLDFEEQEARVYAGLSLVEYEQMPGNMEWCTPDQPMSKAELIVLRRLHLQVAQVQQHLSNKKKR